MATEITLPILLLILAPVVGLVLIFWRISKGPKLRDVQYHPTRHHYDDTH